MRLSLFSSAEDNSPIPLPLQWGEFVEELQRNGHQIVPVPPGPDSALLEKTTKLRQPMFSPAEFRENGRRCIQDAVLVHCGVLDLDHLDQERLGAFMLHMADMGLECLLYTSWSHSPENVSVRAIVPFSRPVSAMDWGPFWPRFNHVCGGFGDPQCKNVDRAYFLPATTPERAPYANIHHMVGRVLDVDQVAGVQVSAEALAASRARVPISREEIATYQKTLQRKNPDTGLALARVLNGEPWAEPGNRDNVLFRLMGDLARGFPNADPVSIARIFATSLTHFPGEFSEATVIAKFERRQGEVLEEIERKEREALTHRKQQIALAFRTGRDTPYTEAELEQFAKDAGCSVQDFRRRWIIQRSGGFYFYVAGKYVGPFGKDDAKLAAHTYLSPATSLGVRLEEITITGDFVQRAAQDLAMDYGTVAEHIHLDLCARLTYFEGQTATLVEAPCPIRGLDPQYSRSVDQWLRLLGGESYQYLELWLAWVTALERPCVALFVEGKPGAGKSLLAKGVARLWTTGTPTTMEQAMGSFNQALAQCPLVLADEVLPKDFRGRGRTGELREFIQQEARPYKRKFMPDALLKGSARVIVAANNRTLLDGEQNLTPADMEAIMGRILHIEATEQASQFLKATSTSGWVSDDVIAKHVLWLVENVERPTNPPRFLVEAPPGRLHRHIPVSTTMGSAVAHWLVAFLLEPQRLRNGAPPGSSAQLVRCQGGRVLVNARALVDHWDRYPTNVPLDRATAKNISDALRGMDVGVDSDARVRLALPGFSAYSRPRFRAIRTEDLLEWAQGCGYATPEEILGAIAALEKIDSNGAGHT